LIPEKLLPKQQVNKEGNMAKKDKFSIFLEEKKEKWEKFLKEKGVLEKYPPELLLDILDSYKDLGIIYRYFGDKQKSSWFFKYLASFNAPSSRYGNLSEESLASIRFLHNFSIYIVNEAIYFNLSNSDPLTAEKLFGWAAENFVIPDSTFSFWMENKYYDDIAVAHLWRGYSLLNLGKYEEAHELLVQVAPYLDRYKKKGSEMWRTVEYALTKAVVPLCEYKLNPTDETLKNAQKGIEDFIKSLRENRDKLEAYLYYFHLKEKFADVYEAKSVPADLKQQEKKPLPEVKVEFLLDDEKSGIIAITSLEGGSEDFLGTNSELEKYCDEIRKLGDYPNLASLMETYLSESYLEPEPLVEECERLLARNDVAGWIKEKTEVVLRVAEDAGESGHNLYFYFSPEID
jgi:hypothetical protein